VAALAGRTVGLLGAGTALDDRIDRLEVARVRRQRHGDVAGRCLPRPLGAKVVLDVSRAPLRVGRDRLDRPLAFELAQDRLVRPADDVGEHVEAPAMSHPDHDLVGAALGGQLDRLVEHRDQRVEALD
jgi:hypothetical protein